MARDIVYFDLEPRHTANDVGGWGNKHQMGISIAVTYSTKLGEYLIYEEDETNELIVTFNKGRAYVYAGVPEELAIQLANAPSVGQMMNSEIKPNYPARKL